MQKNISGWSTAALHAGNIKDPNNAHITPIYASSTYTFDTADEGMERFRDSDKTQIYSRWGNPTHKEVEQKIVALEAFELTNEDGSPLQLKAILHASGQAAFSNVFLATLKAGDKILSHFSLYGGVYELMHKVLASNNIEPVIVDMHNLNKVHEAFAANPQIKLVHIETPANPTIQCIDIEAVTKIAHMHGVKVCVDNTFASPYLQQPFAFGVDFVVHSTTKFLNGHGTAMGGVLIGKDIEFMNTQVWKWYALLGGNANPFDAYLLMTGIKTLELRMERHCHNAMQVAKYLEAHNKIALVNYTGLTNHPDFAISAKQMRHPGPMLSYELKGGLDAGKKFLDALQLCTRAVSLGTVDTLVSHPASMTHYGVPREQRIEYGITDGLIRMSVGIENVQDILSDLEQALNVV